MPINILTTPFFSNFNIEAQRGHKNSGGGMSCLMNAAYAALSSRYKTHLCTEIGDCEGDFVLLDLLFVTNRTIPGKAGNEIITQSMAELEADKNENKSRTYILWCAEKTLLRLRPAIRKRLIALVDNILVTDPYITNLFRAINVYPTGYLCDAIDSDLFRVVEKEMTVTAVGALKYIKNIDWIIEVFKLLEGKTKRIYFGGASLWSAEKRLEDLALIPKIKRVTEEYYPNSSPIEVAYHNARAAFSVNDTWHDCSSRANEELLMSGVISIHGQHPLFDRRPGFRVRTPEEAVAKIADLTNDFTALPDPALHQASRAWALKHVSTRRFLAQFESVVRCSP